MSRTKKVLVSILLVLVVGVAALAVAMSHTSPCGVAPNLPAGAQAMRAIAYRCYGSRKLEREARMGNWIEPIDTLFIKPAVLSRLGSQKFMAVMANLDAPDLTVLRDLIESGKVKPVIDRQYPLTQTGEALRYLETGHARGKVVIEVQ